MPELKQMNLTKEKAQDFKVRKRTFNKSRLLAFAIIVFCVIAVTGIMINKGSSKIQDEYDLIAVGGENIIQTPTPTPTPTPKPTPSPIDESKIGVYPADITRALVVNDANSEKKVAYLTFDDGPSDNTEIILDVLKEYNAKATFFVMGKTAESNPELIKRQYNEGHTIANHSYSHDYNYIYASESNFREELFKTERIIADIIGEGNIIRLFRFPGGSSGTLRSPYRTAIEKTGYKYVDWNALNSDSDGKPFSYERGISEIKKYCTATGDVIVLMHDSSAKKLTAQMLPQIMDYLIEQGYTFERIVP